MIRRYKRYIIICVSLIVAVCLCICIHIKKNSLYDQLAGARWSETGDMTQITLFYPTSRTADIKDMFFVDLDHKIQTKLDTTAYSEEAGKKDNTGISFPSAVQIAGQLTINSDNASIETTAYGVDGEYFIFHPMNLLYGSYLNDDDIMDDGVVLDEDAAWKLFGSANIEGKTVTIGGIPHIIKGVVRKDSGKFADASGLEGPMSFVSINSLKQYGKIYGSYSYEMILPEPVEGFAIRLVREVIGESIADLVVTENSYRFDYKREMALLKEKGIRSMNIKGVVFPYYENISRAWEDIFSALYLIVTVIFAVNFTILAIFMYRFFKSDTFKRIKKQIKHNIVYSINKLREERRNYEED